LFYEYSAYLPLPWHNFSYTFVLTVAPKHFGASKIFSLHFDHLAFGVTMFISFQYIRGNNKMNKSLRLPAQFLGLLAAFSMLTVLACDRQQAATTGQTAYPPTEVGVVTLEAQPVTLTTELPGRTSAYLVADIRPQVNGLLQTRKFVEGADVKEGELLYQIDPAQYQAAYEQAKAALQLAESRLPTAEKLAERMAGLAEIDAVGQQDADEAQAALAAAEAQVAAAKAAVTAAKINLDYTPVKAPISGRIGRSSVTPGALVTAYQAVPLATIQQIDPIYVDVTQASADLLKLRRSEKDGRMTVDDTMQQGVKLYLEDGSLYPHEGSLQFRDVTVDPATGTVTLRIVFPNPDYMLLPGMYVRAVLETGTREDAILASQQGVFRNTKSEPYALVVGDDNVVVQQPLTLDRTMGSDWLVAEGLKAGDRIIVEGSQRVGAGSKVTSVEMDLKTAAAGASASE
jgi:membrane fusion protein (multidrug efflux system)